MASAMKQIISVECIGLGIPAVIVADGINGILMVFHWVHSSPFASMIVI
jgi:hypothetical protein